MPLGLECGMGLVPWSPLGGGFLTGKYGRDDKREGDERLNGGNPFGASKFTDRNWAILDALRDVAAQLERPLAQVALAWAAAQPGITAPIVGASRVEQLADNLAALTITFSPEQLQRLAAASAPEPAFPYAIFTPEMRSAVLFGGATVRGWQ